MERNEARKLLIKYSNDHSRLKKTEHELQFAIQNMLSETITDLDPTISEFIKLITVEEVDLLDMGMFFVTDFHKLHLNRKIDSLSLKGRIFDDQIIFRALNRDGSKLLKLTVTVYDNIVKSLKIKVFEY